MPLKKLVFKPGIDRESSRYATEGGWYECDKVRFNSGTPEKIGGWQAVTSNTFLGTCRSLYPWVTNSSVVYVGVGTHIKYYVYTGGAYYDITPVRSSATLNNPFTTTNGSAVVTVADTAHGAITGDYVTFSGASSVGGLTLNSEYEITYVDANSYTITASSNATSSVAGGGGATVTAAYQANIGAEIESPLIGWGGGGWGSGTWGSSSTTELSIRIWNASNFGEDLIYGPRGGSIYYWDSSVGTGTRGADISTLSGASDTPTIHNLLLVSDLSRFVFAFGVNDIGSATIDPLLVRWSDQEDAANWTPAVTNQSGSLRLSRGSEIKARAQTRQEILVWTDIALYSLQYVGTISSTGISTVWGANILADNVSIVNDRSWAAASGIIYWMGNQKFYVYAGDVNTLDCLVQNYVFRDMNYTKTEHFFAGTNGQFNEIWWFYCSADSDDIDRYVIYNYVEKLWYYGNLERTAWIDIGVASEYPIAATTNNKLVYHEVGVDDLETATPAAIEAYITSSQIDIEDGHHYGFVTRVLPDMNFVGSTAVNPSATLTLMPLKNSGAGYQSPDSVGGSAEGTVTRTSTSPIEAFTGQINVRVRGRQMSFKVSSTDVGVAWQLGHPRIDVRPDGRGG